jgi:hypothetical protein
MSFDVTIVQTDYGLVMHKPDCPDVEYARVSDLPLVTMLACKGELSDLPPHINRHSCLQAAPPHSPGSSP